MLWLCVPSKYQGPANLRDWCDCMMFKLGFSTTALSRCHLMGIKSPPPYQKEMLQVPTIPFTLKIFKPLLLYQIVKMIPKKKYK